MPLVQSGICEKPISVKGKEVMEQGAELLVILAVACFATSQSIVHGTSSRAKTMRAPCKKA